MAAPLFYNQGDQDIYNSGSKFVPQERYRLGYTPPVQGGGQDASTPSFGIPNTNAFTNSGDNNFYSGSTSNLINDFNAINKDKYFNSLPTPNVDGLDQSMRDKTFMGMRSYNENQDVNPVDAGEYLAAGQDIPTRFDPTIAGRVQETLDKSKDLIGKGISTFGGFGPVSFIASKLDRFNTLPAMDREYINQSKYYTGPTVFGENKSGLGKDPYGINTRSMFGNYGAYVDKMAAGYEDKYGDMSEEDFNKLSNFQRTKIAFYRAEKEKRARDLKIAQSEAAAMNDKAQNQDFQKAMAQGDAFYDNLNRGKGASVSKESREKAGPGFSGKGTAAEMGAFADGGRAGYFFGGRARLQGGGRINFRGGGMDMGNESNQTQSANMGGGATGDFSTGEQTMNHNRAMRDNQKPPESPVKNIIDAGSEISYLNNLKNLNLPGLALNFGVNKFRNFLNNKKIEEDDKLSALPTNNYFADLNDAQIKQLKGPQKMGKDYGNFSDQQILDNITPFGDDETAPATLKDVQTFYGSNGGRAMFKNGGLASIL